MPIDYSKWDNLDEYSDSDAEDTAHTRSAPRVTRLDAPSRVTFGGRDKDGTTHISTQPLASSTSTLSAAVATKTRSYETMSCPKDTGTTPEEKSLEPSSSSQATSWTTKGGSEVTKDKRQLYWSQDRYSVQIRVELRSEEKVRSIQIDGILPYSDRHCATGSHEPRLIITGASRRNKDLADFCVLDGKLPHAVHLAENDDDEIDWNVEIHALGSIGNESRYVSLTLYKAVPMQGIFVWWKRPLLEFDEIELEERSAASEAFLQAWDEAHRQFREKHKK